MGAMHVCNPDQAISDQLKLAERLIRMGEFAEKYNADNGQNLQLSPPGEDTGFAIWVPWCKNWKAAVRRIDPFLGYVNEALAAVPNDHVQGHWEWLSEQHCQLSPQAFADLQAEIRRANYEAREVTDMLASARGGDR